MEDIDTLARLLQVDLDATSPPTNSASATDKAATPQGAANEQDSDRPGNSSGQHRKPPTRKPVEVCKNVVLAFQHTSNHNHVVVRRLIWTHYDGLHSHRTTPLMTTSLVTKRNNATGALILFLQERFSGHGREGFSSKISDTRI